MAIQGQVRSIASANSSAVDLVTAEIRRAVLTGALPAGAEFSIRDLAEQLGVSHIPIREALRRLEGQGLIVLRQARAASVAPLSSTDLKAIYRLRYEVELPLAGASAGKRSASEVTELDALLEASRDLDPEVAWQGHYDFHQALVHPAANEWDDRVLHTLWFAAERYTHLVFDPTRITDEERARRYETHRVLRDAALVDDPAAMAEALRQHLSVNESRILDFIGPLEEH
jgi:DNA-binding GntR family transcriptional regulator